MKLFKAFVISMLLLGITHTTNVFAGSEQFNQTVQDIFISPLSFEKIDPLKELESLKANAKDEYKQKKMSKEEFNSVLAKIDRKVKAVKEFNKLSLDQQKDKLMMDFSKAVAQKVQEGAISEADFGKIIATFNTAVSQWDGKGFPTFYHKGVTISKAKTHDKQQHAMDEKTMHHMHMKFMEALDKAVRAGTITEQQKKEILQYLHDSMKEMK